MVWYRRLPVGAALRARLGAPRTVRRLGSSPRSRVWLVEFDGDPAIVKQLVGRAEADERYRRELAALRVAARSRPAVVPAVLGTDPAERVLVLEYVPPTVRAPDWVVAWSEALARMHATATVSDVGVLPPWRGPDEADVRAFLDLARRLDVPVPAPVPDELGRLLDRLDPAGRYALLHGDPCPDNSPASASGVRFIDLEQASLGDGDTELAYLRIGFPTCWCVSEVPDPLRDRAERAYRDTWRSLTGAEPYGDVRDACAGWLLRGDALVERARRGTGDYLARLAREDWRWGTATARERLAHRLAVVAAADHPDLAGLARLSRAMRERLLQRWPALRPLPCVSTVAGDGGAHQLR